MIELNRDFKSGGYIITRIVNTDISPFHQQLTLTHNDMQSLVSEYSPLEKEAHNG
jgi:hypothetical protein